MKIPNETIEKMVAAYFTAAAEKEQELHAPTVEWPDGFYSKEDNSIIACHAMRAAAGVLCEFISTTN